MAIELPDFEDMARAAERITALSLKRALLEITIEEMEAKVYTRAQTDEKLFQGGKPPSSAFVKGAYEYTGIDGEILPIRKDLAEVSSQLERERMLFSLMKDKLDIWRSEQANQRQSLNL